MTIRPSPQALPSAPCAVLEPWSSPALTARRGGPNDGASWQHAYAFFLAIASRVFGRAGVRRTSQIQRDLVSGTFVLVVVSKVFFGLGGLSFSHLLVLFRPSECLGGNGNGRGCSCGGEGSFIVCFNNEAWIHGKRAKGKGKRQEGKKYKQASIQDNNCGMLLLLVLGTLICFWG